MADWKTVIEYTLDIRNGDSYRPPTRFDLVARDADGNDYEMRIDLDTDRRPLARSVLDLLAQIWPSGTFQVDVDDRNVIQAVKKS